MNQDMIYLYQMNIFYAKHTLHERILLTLALLRYETFQHSEALTSVWQQPSKHFKILPTKRNCRIGK